MKKNEVIRKVMWGDLDSLGIVFYPRYYEWIDACGHLFFDSIGLNLKRLWEERKIQFGLVETSCRYFRPGRYHQEIRITTKIDALEQKTVLLKHVMHETAQGSLLVKGFEKRICLDVSDPEEFRAVPIPPDIHAILEKAAE